MKDNGTLGSDEVVGIFTSDTQFSHNAPVARGLEPDWYVAMRRPISFLRCLQAKHGCPIVISGDLLQKWDSPPELVNFLLEQLPFMYAIPGNHDLPYHSLDEIHRSAYWTLVKGGIIHNITPETPEPVGKMILYGFPCGVDVSPVKLLPHPFGLRVAVVHEYIWWGHNKNVAVATEDNFAENYFSKLKGFDAAVFGDNHKGFLIERKKCSILNCGALLRRNSDEADYRPSVGLLYGDGKFKRKFLDTSEDQIMDLKEAVATVEGDFTELLEGLEDLEVDPTNYESVVNGYLDKNSINSRVRKLILGAMKRRKR